MMKWILLAVTHALALGLGFAAGIYTLPVSYTHLTLPTIYSV